MDLMVLLALLLLIGGPALFAFGILRLVIGRPRPAAIPRAELAALGTAIKDADQLAAHGRVGDGLSCLVAGMRRAQQSHAGNRWSGELVERWQAVVEEYATEHRIGPSSEIVPAAASPGRGDEASPAEPTLHDRTPG